MNATRIVERQALSPDRCEPGFVMLPDERRVGVRERGTGEPTFVFLHGLLDSSEGWSHIADRLPHRCVAIDLPGFGPSDLPRWPRISAYAEDVSAVLRALAVSRFVLVGHSFGGAIAAAVAERLGEDVLALVLLAPAGFGRFPLAEAVSVRGVRHVAHRVLPLALARREAVRLAYRTIVAGREPDPDVVGRVTSSAPTVAPGAVAATQAVAAAGLSSRAFHRRRLSFRGPVTALWGLADRVVPPAHAEGVRTALPQAEIERWHGMGHHPQRERCDELVRLLMSCAAGRTPRIARSAA